MTSIVKFAFVILTNVTSTDAVLNSVVVVFLIQMHVETLLIVSILFTIHFNSAPIQLITETYIKCRVCNGESCKDGSTAKSEECHHGEGSCYYSRITGMISIDIRIVKLSFGNNFFTTAGSYEEIIRGCGEMWNGAIVEGCFDVKGWVGHANESVSILYFSKICVLKRYLLCRLMGKCAFVMRIIVMRLHVILPIAVVLTPIKTLAMELQ